MPQFGDRPLGEVRVCIYGDGHRVDPRCQWSRRRPYLGAGSVTPGLGPVAAQVSQISWPRSTLLGVAVHACPTAQISDTGVEVPR